MVRNINRYICYIILLHLLLQMINTIFIYIFICVEFELTSNSSLHIPTHRMESPLDTELFVYGNPESSLIDVPPPPFNSKLFVLTSWWACRFPRPTTTSVVVVVPPAELVLPGRLFSIELDVLMSCLSCSAVVESDISNSIIESEKNELNRYICRRQRDVTTLLHCA